jgi:glutamyl-tRNA synthetase
MKYLKLLDLLKLRAKSLSDIVADSTFYFKPPDHYDRQGVNKFFLAGNGRDLLQGLLNLLIKEDRFETEILEIKIREQAEKLGIGAGKLIHPLRLALTGVTTSPGIFDVLHILGKENVIERIKSAIEYIEKFEKGSTPGEN